MQFEATGGIGEERSDELLELGDSVADRVVVVVQFSGRLRDVQVRVQQDRERAPELGPALGGFVQFAQSFLGELSQQIRIDLGEKTKDAEFGEPAHCPDTLDRTGDAGRRAGLVPSSQKV